MKQNLPPKLFLRFFRWYCHPKMQDYIEGDLMEVYEKRLKEGGKRKADVKFIVDVLLLFRPSIIRPMEGYKNLNTYGMYKSYFKIGWRNLIKDKTYSAISILGLSVSTALGILIFQYSIHELRFDNFIENADQIYRITASTYKDNLKVNESAETPHFTVSVLSEKLPEVAQAARLMSTRYWFDCTLKYNDLLFNEHNLYYADPSLLSMFSLKWEKGNNAALKKPFTAVLTSSTASRYFGTDDPIGKVLHLKGSFEENDYTVTGVVSDLPSATHLDFTILLSLSSLESNQYFQNFTTYTYIEVEPKTQQASIQEKINDFVSNHATELNLDKSKVQISAQPITDIHLHSALSEEIKPGGNAVTIYFLMSIAGLILFIAWINHINLITARSATKIREVGIRKISGASRFQLISQLLVETLIINGLSILIAIILVSILATPFYRITGLPYSFNELSLIETSVFGLSIFFLFLSGIVVAGLYPAWTISSFSPALIVKGKFVKNRQGFSLREALIVFQFTCAIGLTSAVLVFNKQFQYLQRQNLGVDVKQTLIVKAPTVIESSFSAQLASFKTHLQGQSIVNSISSSSAIPGEVIGWTGDVSIDTVKDYPSWNFLINIVDVDFIESYRLHLIAGRDFIEADYPSGQFGSKIEPIILNVKGLKALGYNSADEAIDTFIFWGDNKCRIVGIIDDFHQQSLKSEINPILFSAGGGSSLSVKLSSSVNQENLQSAILFIQEAWKKFFPGNPFDFFFLDNYYNAQYANDKNVINLFYFYCGLAILISCLGLFGLATLTVQQRTKEIGIRKVLGASVSGILVLLTKDFIKLIVFASIVSTVVSYMALNQWLEGFAYRIDLGWELFVVSGIVIMCIGILTIGYKSGQAATANPVNSLRSE